LIIDNHLLLISSLHEYFKSMVESIVKPVNLLKAGYSYLQSSLTGKPDIKGMPVSVSMELTNNCNLSCPHCSSGSGIMTRKRGFMDIKLFKKVIKELNPYLYNINLYFQGEPMLHPLFFTFLSNCMDNKSIVSTNGHYLSAENSEKLALSQLTKLIISIDGMDQESYSTYRINGDLDKVTEGLQNVSKAIKICNSSLKIEIQFLVNGFNEHQIPKARELAKKVNATLRLKSMQIADKKEIGSWLPSDKRFRRYKLRDGEYVINNSLPDRCARLWFNPVVTWDGKVVPCCFDKDAEYVMGDLITDSFRDIWDGPKYRIFRKSILTGRHMIEICRNCTSGLQGVRY
jgi:radical SAM protein with 4Fe4S-binding SPASM domain